MKLFHIALVLALLAWPLSAAAAPVNGYLHEIDGQAVLHVWGTHYEMGFAHGYYEGAKVVELMHEYILRLIPPVLYEPLHLVAGVLFALPPDYHDEAAGIIDGTVEAGASLFVEPLGREMDVVDLMIANAVADIGAMACSTQIAWDEATADEPRLAGETAVVRNLDWALAGDDPMLLPRETLVIVYSPTDPIARQVVSVAFPGFFGCLTCLGETGLTAIVNIAHNGIPLWENSFTPWFVPVGISLREALHESTPTDTTDDMEALIAYVSRQRRSGAVVINLAVPNVGGGDPGVVLEVDNKGEAVRGPADDMDLPENVLISTNHLRKLRGKEECDRYDTMVAQIDDRGGRLDLDAMWAIEQSVVQTTMLSTTAQTTYVLPAEREMGVTFSDGETLSPFKEPAVLTWDEVTAFPDGVDPYEDEDDEPESDDDDDDDEAAGCGA
jgi:hypothetical protein